MRIIKAFVHNEVAEFVIKKLEKNGVKNIMVEQIEEISDWSNKSAEIHSLEFLEKYNIMVKIEFACPDNELKNLCDLIKSNSKTGNYDEGLIIVQPAEKLIYVSSKHTESKTNNLSEV